MKKTLTMKKVEKRSKETERRKALDVLCSWSAVVVCCVLHCTDSLGTQNTGTPSPDITLSNKL